MCKEEFIEELDINSNIISVYPKSELKNRMFLHKCSLVIPRTFNNKFIFSKRSKTQYPFPDTWICCIGGKVLKNESYLDGAIRESIEEVGFKLNLKKICHFVYDKKDYKAFFMIYTTEEEIDPNNLKPDPKEIQYFKSFSLEEIKKEICKNPQKFASTSIDAINCFIKYI